jgi:hypothetical protein
MRSTGYGRISRDHAASGSRAEAPQAEAAVSTAAAREAIRRRYGQWQVPGARYAALARIGLKRAERLAVGDRDDD